MKKNFADLLKSKISGISYDSRKVRPGDIFVAIPGIRLDGTTFVPQAVEKGARAVVAEKECQVPDQVDLVIVRDARQALAELAAKFYDHPSRKMKTIAITGTNGKTTIAYLLESILKEAGHKVGLISTVEVRIGGRSQPSVLTTPGALELQAILAEMLNAGVTHLVMEVSSHALAQQRVHGMEYDVAIYTNLTHEHLDYHKSLEEYLRIKKMLFRMIKPRGCALINVDDPYSRSIAEVVEGEVLFYGVRQKPHELRSTKHSDFDVVLEEYDIRPEYMRLKLDGFEIRTPLIGVYNIYNILAAFQCGLLMQVSRDTIRKGIERAYVPGRFERIAAGQKFSLVVDFAHTPDALGQLLHTVRGFKPKRIILVFGCPGDRDREKRPIMGRIARELAEIVIVTTDDPHAEDPLGIIRDIGEVGEPVPDRKAAIEKAISLAQPGDFVVLAGRGHEKYQDFNGKKVEIDDREAARAALLKLQSR